jgi:hypothetical protein
MAENILTNDLYLAVLPMIHMGEQSFGSTEQILTLFPDKSFATVFFEDEVQSYISTFKNRADRYLSGGHVAGYDCHQEPVEDGRVIVRVTQNVRH